MMPLAKRINHFQKRARWIADLTQNPFSAAQYLVSAKFSAGTLAQGRFGRFSFYFRPSDENALYEIVIKKEYHFLEPLLKGMKDLVVIDVGAHIGLFSLAVLNANSAARIYSVEASPETYEILKKNIKLAESAAWRAENCAASASADPVGFDMSGPSMSHRVSKSGATRVQGISLMNVIQAATGGAGQVQLMKVDIEGSEEGFICSAPEQLARVDRLVIELHPNLCNTDRVLEILRKHYTCIDDISGRKSAKPLLHCYNDTSSLK